MKAALVVAAGWMLSCAAVQAADRGFDDIVHAISDQFHTHPLHIPFFGLVNFATFAAQPAGVKHVDLAVFENLGLDDRGVRDLAETIRSMGRGWLPFVQVHDRTETVLIYMTQDRGDCKLLLATIERGEVTVVELKLNPEGLEAWLRQNGY
jgi:hypothetical protein